MRYTLSSLLVLLTFVSACSRTEYRRGDAQSAKSVPASASAVQAKIDNDAKGMSVKAETSEMMSRDDQPKTENAALSQSAPNLTERKIIRNGDLTIETAMPADLQRKVSSLAENHGGFVVTSESAQSGDSSSEQSIRLTLRVPSAQFGAVIGALRGTGDRLVYEKISGQDVTEEFIDLEARLRSKRALESQFLEIMKGARGVEDALQVQRELSEVRTEIERIEGRRRFLENQSTLSTVNVTIKPLASPIAANPTGFWAEVKESFGEGMNAATGITIFLIKTVMALLPPLALFGLPIWIVGRLALRRLGRSRTEEKPDTVEAA